MKSTAPILYDAEFSLWENSDLFLLCFLKKAVEAKLALNGTYFASFVKKILAPFINAIDFFQRLNSTANSVFFFLNKIQNKKCHFSSSCFLEFSLLLFFFFFKLRLKNCSIFTSLSLQMFYCEWLNCQLRTELRLLVIYNVYIVYRRSKETDAQWNCYTLLSGAGMWIYSGV